jgi:membrane associated rhomboid family serine protease
VADKLQKDFEMSYYRQQNRRRLSVGEDGNALTMLIAIILAVFVVLAFVKVIYYFSFGSDGKLLYQTQVLNWLILPASFNEFIVKPWTLLTHMFVHDEVWHIIANMLWLWGFGYILQDLTGNRQLVPIFIYGALAGAFVYLLAFNTIPVLKSSSAYALGASAGVMAIAISATVLAPNYRIFPFLNGGIPLWVLTLIFLIIDLATIPNNNAGGHLAHLGGAAMGFVFMLMLKKGKDWGLWMNNFFDWVNNLFNPDKPKKAKVIKSQLFYKSKVEPYRKTPLVTQQRIDEILDKISQKGYSSLTEEEKEILKRASADEN